jgi:hypothetical protein
MEGKLENFSTLRAEPYNEFPDDHRFIVTQGVSRRVTRFKTMTWVASQSEKCFVSSVDLHVSFQTLGEHLRIQSRPIGKYLREVRF